MTDPDFTAQTMALVPRVLPEAIETIRMIRALAAELRTIRAEAQTTEGLTSA